jgi:hypothetical protein
MASPKSPKNSGGGNTSPQTAGAERRGAVRVPLTLAAELMELEAGSRISGRLADSSKTGCYVDSLNCFPAETLLRIQILKGKEVFEGDGRVVYARPGLGMGIIFTEIAPEHRERLYQWMEEGSRLADLLRNRPIPVETKKAPLDAGERFEGLLQLLVDKNVITAAEARKLQAEIAL